MASIEADLPVLPPHVDAPPSPSDILLQPSIDEKKSKLSRKIGDETFVDIDPGVFDNELLKCKLYMTVDPHHPEEPKYQNGDITEGSYAGTQAALTHLYNRIEKTYESFFDVMQIEPTLPRLIQLEQKQSIYQWSSYPLNSDGSPAQYPPHLELIPKNDQVSANAIFGFLGLKETGFLVAKLVPNTFEGKTFNFVQSIAAQTLEGNPMDGTLGRIEEYNRSHRKSGTDIESGQNIGLLPDWFQDRRFADQSFTGTNPTTITVVPDLLLQEFIATACREGYADWAAVLPTVDPKTLFVQDSRNLRAAMGIKEQSETLFNKEPLSDDNWGCAAVTLLQLHPDGRLHPIAIVIDYKDSMENSVTIFNKRMLPSDPTTGEKDDFPWRYAKTCAQVTDFVRHEIGVHLTRAHFVEEALIVATHRCFQMSHVVFKLLQPHWFKTLSLNAAARATLVPQIIKDLVGFKPEYLYQYIRTEFENFDYTGRYFPEDLRRRGFPDTVEGLADPRYRDYAYARNMLPMWYCIRNYVKDVLAITYNGDGADQKVQSDPAVRAWCQEMQTTGHLKLFPTITTFDGLCDAVTMAIHIASPFHSAVNYLQNFYQAFVIAKPPSLCAPLPTSLAELKRYTEADLIKALPIGRQRQWLLSVQVPWLLSSKPASERNLVTFAHSQWRTLRDAPDVEGQKIAAASEKFFNELRILDVEFTKHSNEMNEDSIPYSVMDPDNTAVSILI